MADVAFAKGKVAAVGKDIATDDSIDVRDVGMGSFAFKTAQSMLAADFVPDTISSDLHVLNLHGPVFDQATTLSKFLCLGLPLVDVVRATTVNAATALRRPDLGTLRPGAVGDATVFSLREGTFDYVDSVGEVLRSDKKIVSDGIVLGGRWRDPQEGLFAG